MPPRCAPLQVVIIPIVYKENTDEVLDRCAALVKELKNVGVRTKLDDRENYTPGWKYNHWEMRGVCIRIEIGPRDLKNETARLVRRDTNAKTDHHWSELATAVPAMLEDIHHSMLNKARHNLETSIVKVCLLGMTFGKRLEYSYILISYRFFVHIQITCWDEVMPILNEKKLIMAPWCEDPASEDEMKKETARMSQAVQEEVSLLILNYAKSRMFDCIQEVEDGCAPALTGGMKSLCIPLEQVTINHDYNK